MKRKLWKTMIFAAGLAIAGMLPVSGDTNPVKAIAAGAASSADLAETAKTAYYNYLTSNKSVFDKEAKKRGKHYKARFTVMDLNKDKVPELKVQFGTYDVIYTYTGGKVSQLVKSGTTGNIGYCTKTNMIAVRDLSTANSMTENFYQLKGGKLVKKHSVYISWRSMTYRVDGRTVSRSGYRKFANTYNQREFGTLHEISKSNCVDVIFEGYDQPSYTLEKGTAMSIKVHTLEDSVQYSSSKKSVAKVSSKGIVTAVKAGNAVIKAKAGNKKTGYTTYSCKIKVVNAPKSKETALKKGKSYPYDLNGDGEKETILWKVEKNSDTGENQLVVMSDHTEILRRNCTLAEVSLVDIDRSDSFQEIRVQEKGGSDYILNDSYYRLEDGALKLYAAMPENSDFIRYKLIEADGDGTLRYEMDTPAGFYGELGNYYAYAEFTPENGKLAEVSPGVYPCTVAWSNQVYTATKTLKAMTKAGDGKQAFTILKNGKFHIISVVKKKDRVYLKLQNMAGNSGWIKLPESKFIKEADVYLWG